MRVESLAMTSAGESLLDQALALAPDDRVRLASEILASVDEGHDDPDEVERLWAMECERRVAQLDSGEADLLTWDEVLAEIDASGSQRTAG